MTYDSKRKDSSMSERKIDTDTILYTSSTMSAQRDPHTQKYRYPYPCIYSKCFTSCSTNSMRINRDM